MKSTFKSLKEALVKRGEPAEFFTQEVLDVVLKDRVAAAEVLLNGGDVQAFYRGSETAKTEFYNKNSCAYCVLLELLWDCRQQFTVGIVVDGIGGTFTERVDADSEKHAAVLGLKQFRDRHPEYRGMAWTLSVEGSR